MSTKPKKTVKRPVVEDADPTNLAELLAAFKALKAEQRAAMPVRPEPIDRSFIDQFHARLCALEKNNGTLLAEPPERPHPDDDKTVTRLTPNTESFDLKENVA
jgi:hypothetical protein